MAGQCWLTRRSIPAGQSRLSPPGATWRWASEWALPGRGAAKGPAPGRAAGQRGNLHGIQRDDVSGLSGLPGCAGHLTVRASRGDPAPVSGVVNRRAAGKRKNTVPTRSLVQRPHPGPDLGQKPAATAHAGTGGAPSGIPAAGAGRGLCAHIRLIIGPGLPIPGTSASPWAKHTCAGKSSGGPREEIGTFCPRTAGQPGAPPNEI